MVAVPPVHELDVIGPVSVFTCASRLIGGPRPAYAVEVVTTGDSLTLATESGIGLVANARQRDVRGAIDTLLVAGGTGARRCASDEVFAWLRRRSRSVRRIGSVCTGSFVLASAGLLDGRRAATHWAHASTFAKRFPNVDLDRQSIFVRDHEISTSAGITAGMDLSLALVEEDHGSAIALEVARHLVLFLRRPGGQAQFSTTLEAQATVYEPLADLPRWIAEHLEGDLSIEALAERVSMSERNFARIFAREMGMTPARYVELVRLEEARRRLEAADVTVLEVARGCGFGSPEVFRRAFARAFDTTPHEYADRFRARRRPASSRSSQVR